MLLWWPLKETRDWKYTVLHENAAVSLSPDAILFPLGNSGRCGLLARGDQVTVNGVLALPFRVLLDRDQFALGRERLFFSAETPVKPVAFPKQTKEVFCGRCKGKIPPCSRAVRCPCGTWHHETAELPCWSGDFTRCSNPQCGRPVAGFAWKPAKDS